MKSDTRKAYQLIEERIVDLIRAKKWAEGDEVGPLVRKATEGKNFPDLLDMTESWETLEAAVHRPSEGLGEEEPDPTEDTRSQATTLQSDPESVHLGAEAPEAQHTRVGTTCRMTRTRSATS